MKIQPCEWARAWFGCASLSLFLAACGGGGGGGSGTPTTTTGGDTTPPAAINLSGVAAQGAPMSGAAMVLVDATGAQVATATAGTDGKYSLTIPPSSKAPLVLSASDGTTTYFSPVAQAQTGTINVTKLTNLVAAQLSPTGDPSRLSAQIAGGTATVNADKVQAVVAAIEQALAPLLQNAGDKTDPISGTFAADGTGHDKVLMALDVVINPAGARSNIMITVKMAVADGTSPAGVSFVSGQAPPALPAAVATAVLPASDTDTLVANYMSRLQACYALPRTVRVTGTTAASVSAPQCKNIFLHDDPTAYVFNGATVGPNGAFPGLFRDGATGVQFSNPQVYYFTSDGRLLLGWTNTGNGAVSYSTTWLTRDAGVLKAVGNTNPYAFLVRPWSELRDFFNREDLTYWATGFEINIPNYTSGGVSIFDHVVVTAPDGTQVTMAPNPGLSYLPVQGTSGTSVLRLAGKFVNPATAGLPRRLTTTNGENLAWAGATDWTDTQLMAINNVGSWRADFYLASNPAVIAATEYVQTLERPLTVTELQARQWATATAAARADAVAGTSANGNFAMTAGDTIQLDVAGTPPDWWTVPAGAIPPTLVQAQGFVANAGTPQPRWNDNTSVSSLARTTTINCSAQTSSDPHCGTSAGTYSGNTRVNLVQLIAYDPRGMEWVTNINTSLLKAIQ